MSLHTLLEAARYLELQELQEQQQRKAEAEAIVAPNRASMTPLSVSVTSQATTTPNVIAIGTATPTGATLATSGPLKFKQEVGVAGTITTNHQQQQHRVIQNSFDIINPLVIDESSGEHKRKQPPLVFRSGTREVHNKLEKHRRAHLKECFDSLKKQLPSAGDEKKTSNLSILHSALRYIQALKKRERELEHEMERLAREKISAQQKLATLKKEISAQCDNIDFSKLLPETPPSITPISETNKTNEIQQQQIASTTTSNERVPIPPLPRSQVTQVNGAKDAQPTVQTAALSVVPVGYPVSQGLVLQKLALVPKSITELTPLVSTPTAAVAHFITTPQQLNGKMVPLVNAQYVVKPVVVVSTPSRPS